LHDSPELRGYTFSHPPSKNEVEWEKIIVKHKLANGAIRTYFKGFRPKFKIEWDESWVNEDDFSNIVAMYNDNSATLTYKPRPDTFPNTSFEVYIMNDFDFTPHGGTMYSNNHVYEGSLELEAINVTATCTNWS